MRLPGLGDNVMACRRCNGTKFIEYNIAGRIAKEVCPFCKVPLDEPEPEQQVSTESKRKSMAWEDERAMLLAEIDELKKEVEWWEQKGLERDKAIR
jgi:hypothetical protein